MEQLFDANEADSSAIFDHQNNSKSAGKIQKKGFGMPKNLNDSCALVQDELHFFACWSAQSVQFIKKLKLFFF